MNDLKRYHLVRDDMRPGDVVAFSGRGFISSAIRFFTRSPISHVGVVFESRNEGNERRVILAESTTLNGASGVQFNRLSERLRNYDGRAWWLPLSNQARVALDTEVMYAFLADQAGEPYDYRGIAAFLARPIPGLGLLLHHGSVRAWFCSELIVAAFAKGGLLRGVEPDHANPQWLCQCRIYDKDEQLVGERAEIPRFNTL